MADRDQNSNPADLPKAAECLGRSVGEGGTYGSILREVDSGDLRDKTPLILIHGINPNTPIPSPPLDHTWDNLLGYFRTVDSSVLNRFKPYVFLYWSNREGVTLQTIGGALRTLLDEMQSCDPQFKDKSIAIVAHSMGGLVARSYMEEWEGLAAGNFSDKFGGERVLRLITLATPHHGTPIANVNAFANPPLFYGSKVFQPLDQALILLQAGWGFWHLFPFQGNRFSLGWDNFDLGVRRGLLSYPLGLDFGRYPEERNVWLADLNEAPRSREYQHKVFAHAGKIEPCHLGLPWSLCRTAAILRNSFLAMESDGIVPVTSAAFYNEEWVSRAGHATLFSPYNHAELHDGKGSSDGFLFGHIRDDLNDIPVQPAAPVPQLTRVTPNPAVGSNSLQTFTLEGSNFVTTSRVRVRWSTDNRDVPGSSVFYDSSTRLRFGIVTGTTADTWSVEVVNPNNRVSSPVTFQVNAPVAINTYVLSTSASNGTVTRLPNLDRYPANSQVTLFAVPSPGFRFSQWSGDASGSVSPITIAMDRSKSVTPVFVPAAAGSPSITSATVSTVPGCMNIPGAQWVTIGGAGFSGGTHVLLSSNGSTTRVPTGGTDRSGVPSSVRACAILVPATEWAAQVVNPGEIYSNTYAFSTAGLTQFNLTTSASPANQGEVSSGGSFASGMNVVVIASPYTGYRFVDWTENGNYVSGDRAFEFNINRHTNLVATFAAAIGPPLTGSITVSMSPTGAVAAGAGWRLSGETRWRGNGTRALSLPFGPYTVEYKPLPAWNPPSSQTVQISANSPDLPVTSGSYTQAQINAPSNLSATVASDGTVLLNWQDNATNEAFFFLEFKPQGREAFSPRSTFGPNATSYVFDQPFALGTICFRVRAADFSTTVYSQYSNEACAAPRPLVLDPVCYSPIPDGHIARPVGRIFGGSSSIVALGSNNTVWRWGNLTGEAGGDSVSPVLVPGLSNISAVAMTGQHALALRSDGTGWAWGDNSQGQLGDGTLTNRPEPVQVVGLSSVTAVSAGWLHSMALTADGTVWTWGFNFWGQLGDGSRDNNQTPHRVPGLAGVIKIFAGGYASFALKSDGTVVAWGANGSGSSTGWLGVGSAQLYQVTPAQVLGMSSVADMSVTESHVLALRSDSAVWSWGRNATGDGQPNVLHPTPFLISGLQLVVAVAAGRNMSFAVQADGTVRGWGSNDGIGDGSFEPRYVPTLVVALTDAVAATSTAGVGAALRANGTVCTWGGGIALGNGANAGPRPVAGHVVGPGGVGALSLVSATPTQFAFRSRTVATRNAPIVSNSMTVSGIESSAPFSVTGGEYSVNGGAFRTDGDGVVRKGDTVALRVTAPGTPGQTATATLVIGGVSGSFAVTLDPTTPTFANDPLQGRSTPVRAIHFTELRQRINDLRTRNGLAAYGWTNPVLVANVTRVEVAHLTEMRTALGSVYAAVGRDSPTYGEPTILVGTLITAAQIEELRAAVLEIW